MAKKKKSKGATKRRSPFPLKQVLNVLVKGTTIAGMSALIVVLGFYVNQIDWQPMALATYEVEKPLVYQNEEELDQLMTLFIGKSLLTLDLSSVKETLVELPWVRSVGVQKQWPGQLIISLEEHEPVAYWNQTAVLNSEGIPLRKPLADMELAFLNGPENRAQYVMENYLLFAQIFREKGFNVEKVNMQPRGAWELTMTEGFRVILGEKDVLDRSRRVVEVLKAGQHSENEIEYIDARYPNGVAIKFSEKSSLGVTNDIAA